MSNLKRLITSISVFFTIILFVSLFMEWIGLVFQGEEYTTSLWSDSEADIKYVIVGVTCAVLLTQLVSIFVDKLYFQAGLVMVIIPIINLILSIDYYTKEKNNVLEIAQAGVDVVFVTKSAFMLFVITNMLLIIVGGILAFIDKTSTTLDSDDISN
ncbi:MAG: hypothetical protein KatS3mg085_695 [Candidatus Dojkabacteria bacterium]|nr:MAG: hypothetical protein KatS3mg085_695 [Candidatus Dojkabacteria bacterium]